MVEDGAGYGLEQPEVAADVVVWRKVEAFVGLKQPEVAADVMVWPEVVAVWPEKMVAWTTAVMVLSGVGACIIWFDGGYDGWKLMVKESCEKRVIILKKK